MSKRANVPMSQLANELSVALWQPFGGSFDRAKGCHAAGSVEEWGEHSAEERCDQREQPEAA